MPAPEKKRKKFPQKLSKIPSVRNHVSSEGKAPTIGIESIKVKTIGTVFLIQFIALWNDWQTTMLYLPTHPTLARAVYEMSLGKSDIGTGSERFLLQTAPLKITASMILAVPITIIFVIFRNKLMGNVSVGGLKE